MLARSCRLPPGFTITTQACSWYYDNGKTYPDGLEGQVDAALAQIAEIAGRRFGDPENLLLVSVRSGSRASMPGMMDTVLNLGLNDETVAALAQASGDARFAQDSYRRFIQMYCNVVLGLDHEHFEEILEDERANRGYEQDTEMTAEDWVAVVKLYKGRVEQELGKPFPQDPKEQLWGADRRGVFQLDEPRAPSPTAASTISRNHGARPSTSRRWCSAIWATLRRRAWRSRATPRPARRRSTASSWSMLKGKTWWPASARRKTSRKKPASRRAPDKPSLEKLMPAAFRELVGIADRLEGHYRDMQDLEFTVEQGKLWMLQTRSGKRTAKAALRIAVDMAGRRG